jgi:hypothetical protein
MLSGPTTARAVPAAMSAFVPADCGERTRDRVERAAQRRRVPGGDQGAGALRRLDDHDSASERGDGRVPLREHPALCRHERRVLGDEAAPLPDLRGEPPAPTVRIERREALAENGHGFAARVQRAGVRGGVDPLGQAGHDDDARLGAGDRELARDTLAVGRHAARADDRDAIPREEGRVALEPELRRLG